jgi:hypothetical protein
MGHDGGHKPRHQYECKSHGPNAPGQNENTGARQLLGGAGTRVQGSGAGDCAASVTGIVQAIVHTTLIRLIDSPEVEVPVENRT